MENTVSIWKIKGKALLVDQPLIMGIVNVTPDSFYNGGRYQEKDKAVEKALTLVQQGADIIDVGGESTRPGSQPVSETEELNRVIPAIEGISRQTNVPISCDTYKSKVAELALQAGASIINDISGFRFDQRNIEVVGKHQCGCILMHMLGTPQTMQQSPCYQNVVEEIKDFLRERLEILRKAGVSLERIVLDPGIGFGKRLEDNLTILRHAGEFGLFDRPVLIGASRKSFIGTILDASPEKRLEGSIAAAVMALSAGAMIFRVHDVAETKAALKVAWKILHP
ncbi:MAG: dihydropteroate synthase [Candidatus Omnitrophica bacterium]|nr:dihydropteroate synthase [Candidatus Omnitrophota bacterium]